MLELIAGDIRFLTFSSLINAVVIDDKKAKYVIFESVRFLNITDALERATFIEWKKNLSQNLFDFRSNE